MTYQEMCETIAEYFNSMGENVTWAQIWEYSPRGELYMIPIWYEEAVLWKKEQELEAEEKG